MLKIALTVKSVFYDYDSLCGHTGMIVLNA